MSKAPTAERALFAANEVEASLSWWQRRKFNFQVEYAKQYALIIAADARQATEGISR